MWQSEGGSVQKPLLNMKRTYETDLQACTCEINTLDEFKPFCPQGEEGTPLIHKELHEYCAETLILDLILKYKQEYNKSLQACNPLIASYTCHLHSHFKIDVMG